jgi:hypothetical protein
LILLILDLCGLSLWVDAGWPIGWVRVSMVDFSFFLFLFLFFIFFIFYNFLNGEMELLVLILVKARRPVKVSRNTNILHTKPKNLTWVLPTTTQILQEPAFEPLFHNNAPLLKERADPS